jgi:peroxiredoxin/predicted 2-oxoglutarate/Fe(II)-dependent dioxygenase YbiX
MSRTDRIPYVNLLPGDPAPWFHQDTTSRQNYAFSSTAGRYVVLCFFATAGDKVGRDVLRDVNAHRNLFDDQRASFFGVSVDRSGKSENRLKEDLPGIRFFWDHDGTISKLYGAVATDANNLAGNVAVRRFWLVLDPALRIIKRLPFSSDGSERAELFSYLRDLPPPHRFAGFEVPPPILILPNVFEADLCKMLISLHEAGGGQETGTMREVDGKTVAVIDRSFKQRRDFLIEDRKLQGQLQATVRRRIVPELLKIFSFKATRMERYVVGCYAAEEGGQFLPHRDNTTKGTAHRRFAVSINLNAEFEGGEVSFPEYSLRGFKAPPGGAVIFPCALLHAVSKVTSGRRYAFLPFLYDEESAKIREANNQFLGSEVGTYKLTGGESSA